MRRSCRNHPVLAALVGLLIATATVSMLLPRRLLVLNLRSPSIRPGIYLAIAKSPAKGDLIEFRAPASPGMERRSKYEFILKPIAASPGEHVATCGRTLRINNVVVDRIEPHDSNGQPLPYWRAHRRLGDDEYFVYSDRVWNSYDSRYFGPIRRGDIVAVRVPLLTWGEPRSSRTPLTVPPKAEDAQHP